ncbi:hypothetical protein J6590_075371 [Homalodisca vitripennis]|nr:hypothetical protein J6590_075371 [Homalodisca vitripennis]
MTLLATICSISVICDNSTPGCINLASCHVRLAQAGVSLRGFAFLTLIIHFQHLYTGALTEFLIPGDVANIKNGKTVHARSNISMLCNDVERHVTFCDHDSTFVVTARHMSHASCTIKPHCLSDIQRRLGCFSLIDISAGLSCSSPLATSTKLLLYTTIKRLSITYFGPDCSFPIWNLLVCSEHCHDALAILITSRRKIRIPLTRLIPRSGITSLPDLPVRTLLHFTT